MTKITEGRMTMTLGAHTLCFLDASRSRNHWTRRGPRSSLIISIAALRHYCTIFLSTHGGAVYDQKHIYPPQRPRDGPEDCLFTSITILVFGMAWHGRWIALASSIACLLVNIPSLIRAFNDAPIFYSSIYLGSCCLCIQWKAQP